jgi:hypothetical protein
LASRVPGSRFKVIYDKKVSEVQLIQRMFLFIFMIVIISVNSYAELIDGPANFRDKPNGKVIFSLNNNVDVETSQHQKDGWYFAGVWVYLDRTALTYFYQGDVIVGETKIRKGAKLYDIKNTEIGVAIEEISIWNCAFYDKKTNRYELNIAGYTHPGNIRKDTAIERILENILNSTDDLSYNFLIKHIDAGCNEWPNDWAKNEPFKAVIYPESVIDDLSPSARVALVFNKDQLAVILHQRPIKLQKYREVKQQPGYYSVIIVNKEPNPKLEEYYRNIMRYSGQ